MTSDELLASRSLNGDLEAFEELVNRFKNRVFALVYRIVGQQQEAEDVSQEVFLAVYEKLYQYDNSKKFAPWIFRIATNASINALRRKKKVILLNFEESYSSAYELNQSSIATDPHLMFERQELENEISSAIMQLPENYRVVITLRYHLDLDNQEIADVLGISRENVEVRIHRARKALRKIILQQKEERGIKIGLSANR
ncbi:MAG: sigma-70 family RNA polymerase sigma factor [Syntrophomonadaceae bacterium]|nr:sigma-70 family RNA polymerase sigma factor [Syntrophomonadaceae bacterium]